MQTIFTENLFLSLSANFLFWSVSIYSESINTKNILFVNVAKNPPFNENDLFEYSRKTFGRVLNCTLYADRSYGFVHFDREYDALKAISATDCQINGRSFRYLSRSAPLKASVSPSVSTTKTVHIGNFRRLDEAKVLQIIGPFQTKFSYTDSSGQNYVSISLDDQSRSHLLNRRPICLNGRVLNVFSDHEEQHKNELSVLIRYVPQRLNDFNLLEYFSQFGRVLNCFRLEKSDCYSVRFENSADLASDLSAIGVHRIKGAPVKVETNLQT